MRRMRWDHSQVRENIFPPLHTCQYRLRFGALADGKQRVGIASRTALPFAFPQESRPASVSACLVPEGAEQWWLRSWLKERGLAFQSDTGPGRPGSRIVENFNRR